MEKRAQQRIYQINPDAMFEMEEWFNTSGKHQQKLQQNPANKNSSLPGNSTRHVSLFLEHTQSQNHM
jgi:hypothetical protein